jgi:hypothetical protein
MGRKEKLIDNIIEYLRQDAAYFEESIYERDAKEILVEAHELKEIILRDRKTIEGILAEATK